MKHYITIPSGKAVSLSNYAKAWRAVKAMKPDAIIRAGDWQWFEVKARDVLRDMMRGLHDRINIRGGLRI